MQTMPAVQVKGQGGAGGGPGVGWGCVGNFSPATYYAELLKVLLSKRVGKQNETPPCHYGTSLQAQEVPAHARKLARWRKNELLGWSAGAQHVCQSEPRNVSQNALANCQPCALRGLTFKVRPLRSLHEVLQPVL